MQHLIAARTAELLRWIGDGAHIYVCGDEKGMGRDVDKALATAIGAAQLEDLRKTHRYQRDVY